MNIISMILEIASANKFDEDLYLISHNKKDPFEVALETFLTEHAKNQILSSKK